ncbi:MAG: hypothetical protein RIS09_1296 [Actinomycetota bacterium]|jgi:predicted Zn-dependent protease
MTPQELIEKILERSTSTECMVIVEQSTEANLRWAESTLTTNGMIKSQSVSVLSFVEVEGGLAVGAATRTVVEDVDIDAMLKESVDAAIASGLADDYMPLLTNHSVGDWKASHKETGPDAFSRIAPELGEMFTRSKADQIELFGYAEHTSKTTWLGSKGGLRLRHDQPAGRIEVTAKSHNRSRSTWAGRSTRDFTNVDIAEVDAELRRTLEWQAKRIDVPAGRYDTILPPGAVGDLLTYAVWMADARSAFEGRSAFSKPGGGMRIGEKLANFPVNLYADPAYKGLESGTFVATSQSSSHVSIFDNGTDLSKSEILEGGVLKSLIQTRATAKLTSQPFTPFGDNFIMDVSGGKGTTEDLVKNMKSGLLLNTLWYIRMVDPQTLLLTGLTRDGVYKVEDGEVVGAVNNFRWNESPLELLGRMVEVGSTTITQPREWADWVHRIAMPALHVKDFNMSTVSQAN